MTNQEIYKKIKSRSITAIMFHQQLAEAFGFLNLHGFKRWNEYQAIKEFMEMLGIVRYNVEHNYHIIGDVDGANPKALPYEWLNYTKMDTTDSLIKSFTLESFKKWFDWETETKKLLCLYYKELTNNNDIADACKIKSLLDDVDEELKYLTRMYLNLKHNYEDCVSLLVQEEIHNKYKDKEDKMGIKIC